jgi:protein-L-isoaspartate O-methyltransferase
MTTCPRGHFVPRRHRDESYVDMPIRVDQFGFNISAPHMHATALEALDIKPGDRYAARDIYILYATYDCDMPCLQCCLLTGLQSMLSQLTFTLTALRRVLDVGCGCGVWTAYAAFLVSGKATSAISGVRPIETRANQMLYMPSTVHCFCTACW